jgi:CheY-like chemotaxis protein
MDVSAESISASAKLIIDLIQAAAWPAVVVGIAIAFRVPMTRFLNNLSELSFKAGGIEATAKRATIEAAAALGAATARNASSGSEGSSSDARDAAHIASVVSHAAEPRAARRLAGANVLWVDDSPDNNQWERRAMEVLGIHFDLSTSTEDAIDKISRRNYDLIISDMGRPPDARAGYTLLEKLRGQGYKKPYVIYAGSQAPEHRAEAKRRGAVDTTNNPQELFELVTTSLVG